MAYTNGIFHINLVSGSDTARTALTSCTASNPSGSITRIAKTGHGLVTGAIVDLTSFSSWLNGAYKITVVDANNFDLDATTWQTTADASGTVTPRGGMNWADAWLTTNSGAITTRIQPGDEIRYAKTEDPTSLGQTATWTDGSQTVTLTTAITKKIEDAISGWTASANITAGTNASRKLGATALQITPAAGFTTGKVAYATIAGGGTQDFSGYTQISFWFRPITAAVINATYRLYLCSDATGDVSVNILNIPATISSTSWQCMTVDYGGALGSNIQSVAIYAVADPGTTVISINNIFAHNSGFNLSTLIGPSTTDCYYTIQSVDDTTIKIDSNNTTASGRGWSGATNSYTTYYRNGFLAATTTNLTSIQEAGAAGTAYSHYSGGWNTTSNLRDGETLYVSRASGTGVAIVMLAYVKLSYFTMVRFSTFASVNYNTFDNVHHVGGAIGFAVGHQKVVMTNCKIYNNSSASSFGLTTEIVGLQYYNNAVPATFSGGAEVINGVFTNNGTASVTISTPINEYGTGAILFRNCSLNDTVEAVFAAANQNGFLWSFDHDDTATNHWGFTYGATINWQTTTKQGSDPGSWKTITSASTRNTTYPILFKIGEIACAASSLVTIKVWVKKDHATNVGAAIFVKDEIYNIDGVAASEVTKASDTNWEELTLTFTPTEAGIVPIYAKTWYVAGNSNTYVGSITATQA